MCIDTEYKVDFISYLPLELIEELVRHLDGIDILNCSKVCKQWKKKLDQENIWRRLCIDRGWFLNTAINIKSWRNLYWLNQNWCKGFYMCYKFSDEDISHSFMLPNFNTTFLDFTSLDSDGEFLILPRRDGINIWDITNDAKIHQRITNNVCKYCYQFDIKVNKKFIIYLTGNYIQILKKDSQSKMYERLKILHLYKGKAEEKNCSEAISEIYEQEHEHKAEVNENYLAVIQDDKKIFIWLLKPWEFLTFVEIYETDVRILDIKIASSHIFILQNKDKQFKIRAYDMKRGTWTLELHPDNSEAAVDDVHPRLIVNKLLVVSVCPCDANRTVLKVWDFNGRILQTTFLPKETYIQCCVINDIVIYRSSKNTITIWSSKIDKIIKEIDINSSFNFIEVCPGDLLLIAKTASFEVWDWKKGKQLYTISEQTHLCYTRLLNSYFYATLVMDMDRETSHIVPQIIVFYFGINILRE
ncbi:uncharacterized protein LOC142319037 [Lycorma delicatula]|uniref:uncharacterized protein LOC142319037 n=1 Tax=Lycorma delicatula TaxID=130591 RepID=UPI003F519EAF